MAKLGLTPGEPDYDEHYAKVLPTIAVTAAQALGTALLIVSSLAFLGLGVQPPVPTWGELLSSDLLYLAQQPWAPLFPGLLIMITAGALNSLADAIRDSGGADQLTDSPVTALSPSAPDTHSENQEAADAFAPAL